MPHVEMRDLQLRARGAGRPSASGGQPPDHIKGMVSSVRSAMKEVHAVGANAGRAKIQASLGRYLQGAGSSNRGAKATATAAQNYINCVDQCAAWHAASPLTYRDWELKDTLRYRPGDTLRGDDACGVDGRGRRSLGPGADVG